MPTSHAAVRRCYRVVVSTMIGAAAAGSIVWTLTPGAVKAGTTPVAAVAVAPAQIHITLNPQFADSAPSALDIVPIAKPAAILAMQDIVPPASKAEMGCLADAVYFEAGSEPWEGQRAVAEVVLRRTHTKGYPHTVCGVVYQSENGSDCQFSFACDGGALPARDPANWKKSIAAAEYVMRGAGRFDDLTGGALYFHSSAVHTNWSNLERTVEIGHQVFYRDPNAITLATADEAASS